MSLVTVIAVLAVTAGVAVWQAGQVADLNDQVASLTQERDAALTDTAAATERVAALTGRVERLDAQLATGEGDQEALAAKLADARAELERMLGPAVPDGGSFGYLVAVGARQDPPRLVVDMAQWFTDQAAVDAAIEDGWLPEGSTTIENGYYIRNDDPRWRILEVAPTARVSLVVWPLGSIDDPTEVTFARFDDMFRRNREAAIRGFPYWLTVEDGIVTRVEQQFIP